MLYIDRLISSFLFIFLLVSLIGSSVDIHYDSTAKKEFSILLIGLSFIISILILKKNRWGLSKKLVIRALPFIAFFILFASVQLKHSMNDGIISLSYFFVSINTLILLPYYILKEGKLFLYIKMLAIISIPVALSVVVGSLGIDNFFGVNLSNKYYYSIAGFNATGGIIFHAIPAGVFLALSSILVFYLYIIEKNKKYLFLVCILVVALLLTQARTAYLTLLAGMMVVLLFKKTSFTIRVLKIIVIAFFALLLFDALVDSDALTTALRVEKAGSGRLDIWAVGWSLIMDNKVYGVGLSNATEEIGYALDLEDSKSAHNTFIAMGVATGLYVGTLYVFCYIYPSILYFFKKPSSTRSFLYALVVASFVSSTLVNFNIGGLTLPSLVLTICLGFALSYGLYKHKLYN